MLKKTIIFLLFFILSFFSWKYLSKPDFQGPGAVLKEALWEWREANDDEEKFDAAKKVSRYNTFRTRSISKNKKNYELSENDRFSLEEAMDFFADITDLVGRFEKSLNENDIFDITKENPRSIYRKIGWFRPGSTKAENCKKESYARLRKKYSAEELYMKGGKVGVLIQLMESPFIESYINELIKIIKEDPLKNERYRDLADLFYPRMMKPDQYLLKMTKAFRLASNSDSNDTRIKIYREEFVGEGVDENNIDDYLIELAGQSPECLASINFTFLRHAKEGLAIERAEKIKELIRNQVVSGKALPHSIYDLGEEVERIYMDGHIPSFYIKEISENKIELLSEGEDYMKDTKDDISFGFVDADTV